MIFGEGISKASEVLDLGVAFGIIEKSGSWFAYAGAKLGQGRETVRRILVENKELSAEIEAKVREKIAEDPTAIKF